MRPAVLVGALALAAGVLLALLAGASGRPHLGPVGPERPVNAGALNPGDIRANNSPTLAVHPQDERHLVVASRVDTPAFGCRLHVSRDAGRTWTETRVPIPAGEQRKCFAPDAAFASDGTLHVSYVTLRGRGNVPHAVWHASSRDGGSTLGAPRRVAGRLAFQVRIATDPRDPQRLYLTWLQAADVGSLRFTGPGNPIVAARSDDGGASWGPPVHLSDARRTRVLAATPAVARDGTVYAAYLDVGDDRLDYEGAHEGFGGPPYPGRFTLVLARSTDRGARWEESEVDAAIVPVERFVAFIPAYPALAVYPRDGTIHVGFHDGRGGDADVVVWTLEDGRWSGPRSVAAGAGEQRLAQLALAPTGRLDVAFYETDEGDPSTATRALLASSGDGGTTFSDPVALSGRGFDARIGFGSERDMPDLGSRIAVHARSDGAVAVWTDTRRGTDASNKQDLQFARVAIRHEQRSLAEGVALAGAGVVLLLFAGLRRRSRG